MNDPAGHDAPPSRALRVAISGASGTIGTALTALLVSDGHRVDSLVRRVPRPGTSEIAWNPARGELDPGSLDGVDAVVHLSGARIDRRWTQARKEEIVRSRVDTARLLAETAAGLERRPSVFVSSSAVGYYGDGGDELLTEESPPGDDFLARLCRDWERATEPAAAAGTRVVNVRAGPTLSSLLGRMLLPFRLGLGGRIGSGRQWLSWVSLDDLASAYRHALATPELAGPVNVVSPNPVRNADFARALGRKLRRPAVLPVPDPVLRLLFGELADVALLAGQRVSAAKLEGSGFRFRHPDLEGALAHALGR